MLLKHFNSDDSAFSYHLSPITAGEHSIFYKFLKLACGNLPPVSTFRQKACFSEACNIAMSTFTCLCWVTRTSTSGVYYYLRAQQHKTQCSEQNSTQTVLFLKKGVTLRPLKKQKGKKRDLCCYNDKLPWQSSNSRAWRHNGSNKDHHAPHQTKKIQDCETRLEQQLIYVTLYLFIPFLKTDFLHVYQPIYTKCLSTVWPLMNSLHGHDSPSIKMSFWVSSPVHYKVQLCMQ